MTNQNIQPIFILPEGAMRNTGKNAQKMNIAAAKAVADTVRTTLGPKGMDKMLVDNMGDVVITNDGVTILDEMSIDNPAAKMIVEVSKVQEKEVGDGTTTAVILGGELLANAEDLLDKNIHPTVICSGYKRAAEKAQEILGEISTDISIKDKDVLKNIALTAMAGKNVVGSRQKLADTALQAILYVEQDGEIDIDSIKIEKKEGMNGKETSLIKGVVIDKDVVHPNMKKKIKNSKILLLNMAIEIKESETDAKISITDPAQLNAFVEQEERLLKEMVKKIKDSKANVVFCQKGIDDLAQHFLAKSGITAARRVKKSDIELLAKSTGATILNNLEDISESELGSAGLVEEKKFGDENMIFVEDCDNPKAVSIIVRGGTEHVVDEIKRALTDAIGDLAVTIKEGKAVSGGGAVEIELSKRLREYAESLSGREQLAVQAFADTLEVIPRTLAENGGLDQIDILTELKAKHDEGSTTAGLNVLSGKVENMWELGVIEPLKIKSQAILSATDAAIMLLRIDDIISSEKVNRAGQEMPPQGMPGGMPMM